MLAENRITVLMLSLLSQCIRCVMILTSILPKSTIFDSRYWMRQVLQKICRQPRILRTIEDHIGEPNWLWVGEEHFLDFGGVTSTSSKQIKHRSLGWITLEVGGGWKGEWMLSGDRFYDTITKLNMNFTCQYCSKIWIYSRIENCLGDFGQLLFQTMVFCYWKKNSCLETTRGHSHLLIAQQNSDLCTFEHPSRTQKVEV